ncbi:MAG: TM1812 family CRISPR-associated protein [Firmicutes bacterium]|nr:TM1812 family CRISPR-associated protein [Bacillota bacterium]
MKERNIFITTLSNTFHHDFHHYYSFKKDGKYTYCDGISTAEAGAKYILSTVDIDKILVLGPPSAVKDENVDFDIKLRDFCSMGAQLPSVYSEYKFFCYRIMQYLNQIDIEGTDIYMGMNRIERKELLGHIAEELSHNTKGDLFDQYNTELNSYYRLLSQIPSLNREVERWIRHYLFMKLSSNYKMRPLSQNEHIKVRFIPTSKKEENPLKMGNLTEILHHILSGNNTKVNLYVDLQGLDIAEAHTFINVLMMLLNKETGNLDIKQIITTTFQPTKFTNPIENQKERLELSELLVGIDAFLQYGKVTMISNYWRSKNIQDVHIERIIDAMETVDLGISLCNITQLELGIQKLKQAFKKRKKPGAFLESAIFSILEDRLKNDYGPLLEGEELNVLELIKWVTNKHFYQQALTIIESRIPIDFVQNGILYYANSEEQKQTFFEVMNQLYWKAIPKDRYQFNAINHYFIKFYRRQKVYQKGSTDIVSDYATMRINDMVNPDLRLKTFTAYQGPKENLIQLYISYLRISDMRNQISHAMNLSEDTNDLKENINFLVSSIFEFVQLYEDIKKDCDTKCSPVIVSNQEFEDYHYANPIQRNKKNAENKE